MQTTTNISAILRGELRSARFKCRHSVAAAANEVGMPPSWVWAWLLARRLKSKMWLRKVWVQLEAVQALFADPQAVREAFYASGELLSTTMAVREVLSRWPEFPKEMYIPEVPKKPAARVITFPAAKEEAR